jgi:hypothetical protein
MSTNLAASVRQRLKNRARAENRLFNDLLQYYVLERFLYRLGQSPYSRKFILKGALMFSVWQGPFTRPTRDIDLAGRVTNSVEELVSTIKAIGLTPAPVEDGLEFLPETVSGEPIIAGADYEGVRVSVIARLGSARIPFHVDIGFGDLIYPAATAVQLPALLDFPPPMLSGYSRESVIAEKYQAMVHHGEINSRLKDFYDVWLLATRFEFDGATLAQAIRATFKQRQTDLVPVPTAFSIEFATETTRQRQWASFLTRSQIADAPVNLPDVIKMLKQFLQPVTLALIARQDFHQRWLPGGPWRTA